MNKLAIVLIFLCSQSWAGEYTQKQSCYSGDCGKKEKGKFTFEVSGDHKKVFFDGVWYYPQKSKKIKGGREYIGTNYTLTVTEFRLIRKERDFTITYRNEKK